MTKSMKVGFLSLLIFALFLGACSGLTESDKPAMTTWWLEPYVGVTRETSSEKLPLVSVSVTAVPGLDTNRILLLTDDAELNRYTAVRWAENLPELITSLVGRSLESSGQFAVVPGAVRPVSEDCNLHLEVREFFARSGHSDRTTEVSVAIDGYFQCESEAQIPIQLNASIPAHGENISEIVMAFQHAIDGVMKDLLQRLQ